MHIHEVTLKNFKPFHGKETVELDTTDNEPLVLIGAKNDRGKSAFFDGVRFCLYGFQGSNPTIAEKRRKAINRKAIRKKAGETFVQVVFEHDGDAYSITRYLTFTTGVGDKEEVDIGSCYPVIEKNGEKVVDENSNGEEYNQIVNTILPENASKFFFFDAEDDLKKYTKSNADVREAIETVLGIQEIRNAVTDLGQRTEYFQDRFLSTQTDADNRRRLKSELEDLRQERTALESQKESKEKEIENKRDKLDDIEDEIEDIEGVAEKRNQLQEIERQIEDADSAKIRAEKRINSILRDTGPLLAGLGAKEIKQYSKPEVGHHLESVINDILEKDPFDGECICGEPLTEDHKEKLENRIQRDANPAEPFRIALDKTKQELPNNVEDTRNDFTDWREERRQKDQRLDQLREKKEQLDSEIDAITAEDHEDLKDRRDDIKEEIGDLEDEIERLDRQIGKKENKGSQKENRIQSLGGATENEQRLENLKKLSERCAEAIENVKKDFVEQRKDEVEHKASEVFQRLTNKPEVYEGIVLDKNYNLRIKTESGLRDVETQSPSAGQTQIIAYSFIAGLNNYTAREAPVIIDTPLGRLDPIHKDRLISYYPQFSNQVVILYQPSELSEGDTEVMERHTSKHLMIKAREDDPATSTFDRIDQFLLRRNTDQKAQAD
jgi:DNA sulfur modification protein DndD